MCNESLSNSFGSFQLDHFTYIASNILSRALKCLCGLSSTPDVGTEEGFQSKMSNNSNFLELKEPEMNKLDIICNQNHEKETQEKAQPSWQKKLQTF